MCDTGLGRQWVSARFSLVQQLLQEAKVLRPKLGLRNEFEV
ncbi:hypothetical protein PanWU01x14_324160 [Parasponia andersonii]|uniref:Uncharacterized protein n=1 Tax=Parasponia andersonii TaxID=3476 RepID=A0A2P5AK96_PARAD|nr:hypothetical protein PanWU01x14_324160 [Parasponia andersonii]